MFIIAVLKGGGLVLVTLRGSYNVLATPFKMNDGAKTLETPVNIMHSSVFQFNR